MCFFNIHSKASSGSQNGPYHQTQACLCWESSRTHVAVPTPALWQRKTSSIKHCAFEKSPKVNCFQPMLVFTPSYKMSVVGRRTESQPWRGGSGLWQSPDQNSMTVSRLSQALSASKWVMPFICGCVLFTWKPYREDSALARTLSPAALAGFPQWTSVGCL